MKTILTTFIFVTTLLASMAVAGCGGQDPDGSITDESLPISMHTKAAIRVDPGTVGLDAFKACVEYCIVSLGAPYNELVEEFGNRGAPYEEESWNGDAAYEWMAGTDPTVFVSAFASRKMVRSARPLHLGWGTISKRLSTHCRARSASNRSRKAGLTPAPGLRPLLQPQPKAALITTPLRD